MTESRPYLLWQDVNIEEETQTMRHSTGEVDMVLSSWTATFEGTVHIDDSINPYREPNITFSRSGTTAMMAARNLEVEADRQGWDIR